MTQASADLTLLACQMDIPETENASARDDHLQVSAELVRDALRSGNYDIVALPELFSIDYSRAAFSRLDVLAEPLDGPSFHTWREVARDCGVHVVYGFPRRADDGYRISVGVVGPEGDLIGYYDKLHLAQYGASMEKEYFDRGTHLFVFEVNGLRLAPIICYDIRIPELSRTLTIHHSVDVILHLGAYFRDESFHTWHQFAVSRAMENQVGFLSLNRAGADYGGSIYCPPWMDEENPPVHFPDRDAAFCEIPINRQEIADARAAYSFLADRLPTYDLPVISTELTD